MNIYLDKKFDSSARFKNISISKELKMIIIDGIEFWLTFQVWMVLAIQYNCGGENDQWPWSHDWSRLIELKHGGALTLGHSWGTMLDQRQWRTLVSGSFISFKPCLYS